jgi:hypothetical protein
MPAMQRGLAPYIAFLAYSSVLKMGQAPAQRRCASTRPHDVTSQQMTLLNLDATPVKCGECNLTLSHLCPHDTSVFYGCETWYVTLLIQSVGKQGTGEAISNYEGNDIITEK